MKLSDEILNGLVEVPVPEYPGEIIVSDEAQPVLVGPIKGNTLMAACCVGKGKLLVAAHTYFIENMSHPPGEDEIDRRNFNNNVIKWLTTTNTEECEIIDIQNIKQFDNLGKYKLIKWNCMVDVAQELIDGLLLSYMNEGGSIFVAATPWGHLQLNPGKSLEDFQVHNFLKNFGIEYTSKCVQTPTLIDVERSETEFEELSELDFSEQTFHEDILAGFEDVPAPEHPGTIIVAGNSQAVLTCDAGKVIIAAAKYGNGRILNCSHDWYHQVINSDIPDEKKLANALIKWLTQGKLVEQEWGFIDADKFDKAAAASKSLVVKFHPFMKPTENKTKSILSYIKKGGSLFAAACPWGWLSLQKDKTLKDMNLYNFLKRFGMFYTTECLYLNGKISLSTNQAKFSNINKAIEKLTVMDDDDNLDKWANTIATGFNLLDNENYLNQLKIKEFNESFQTKCQTLQTYPSKTNPIKNSADIKQLIIFSTCFNISTNVKAPGIDQFPGDFKTPPNLLQNVTIKLATKFANEWLSTGYYLPAGVGMKLRINEEESSLISEWSVRVGSHSDDLSKLDTLERWPCISQTRYLMKPEMTIYSPYGGLVYFQSSYTNVKIEAEISNVVESPYFDLTLPETVNDWKRRKNSIGLWAELASEHIIFTTPSHCIRNLDDPSEVLKFWDKIVKAHHHLRGTDPNNSKRERIVNDLQLSLGYMHSGYPIGTHLDCCEASNEFCIFNLEKLTTHGNWGLFHELGHNLQRDEWTFDGSTEVTVNFFSMHAYTYVLGKKLNQIDWLKDQKDEIDLYFSKSTDSTYDEWKDAFGLALYTFALLIKKFGWASMYEFLHDYEKDIDNGTNLPKNNQQKLDQWVIRYSKICGHNLRPHFEKFGLPISESVDEDLWDWAILNKQDGLELTECETDTKVFFSDE